MNSIVKLYTLKHGDNFKIVYHSTPQEMTFVKGTDDEDAILTFLNLDGMYARCSYHGDVEFIVTHLPRMMERIELEMLCKLSERIGKNGNKIQRLRTKISQFKKSLIPVVDE